MSPSPQSFVASVSPAPGALASWGDSLELALLFRFDDHRVVEVNRAFARKFGRPAPSWVGRAATELVHPDDLAAWHELAEGLSRPPFHASREHRWHTAQGWRWIAWEETAVRDADGAPVAVRAVGRDVTKHRLAEEHYRKLAQAIEQAPVSIAITTPGGAPQYVNSRYTQVSGYTLEEIFENHIPLLRDGHPNEAAYRRFCALVASGEKWAGELRSRRKDGGENWEFVQVSPIRDHLDNIVSLLCLREDISERKAMEERLRQSQKMESLGNLAGGIAHDFNNIISIVRGFTELALSASERDETLQRYLHAVHAAALRAASLVGQIRAFGMKSEPSHRPVRLGALVKELAGLVHETFPRGIDLILEIDEAMESFSADPDQIRQVLLNLCVNARDAMPHGGVLTIVTRRVPGARLAALGLDPTLDYAHLRVSDTGVGMTPAIKARVFEPFFTTKQESGGTGLGLATVYGNVRNHQGAVELESEPGAGATFHVYLPLRSRADDSPACAGLSGELSCVPRGAERLLVVEDEAPIQEMLGAALHAAGYAVESAMNGAEAIERLFFDAEAFDAIVLDLNMPRMGGIDVLRIARQRRPDLPALVMSGNLSQDICGELARLGANEVLAKPFDLAQFGRALRALFDGREATAESDQPGDRAT